MTIKDWVMRNCRFAQNQQHFEFYDPAEYKPAQPLNEVQDKQFWDWVRSEGNPTKVDPAAALEAVLMDFPGYASTFLKTFAGVYKPEKVSFPTGATLDLVEINRRPYIVDFEAQRMENASDWLSGLDDMSLTDYIPEQDFNKDFWEGVGRGYVLYHATASENVEAILRDGLSASDRTRGISNRGMGNAVFTSPEPTSIDSYGDAVLVIDVGKMKAAGYMPQVSQESPFEAETYKSAIAHKLHIEDWIGGEYGSEGLSEDTVAFMGDIPPQFLSLLQR